MQIIRNLQQIKQPLPPLSLTIGNFDGIHLGHLEIINKIKDTATKKNLASAVLTFEPHPISFLFPEKPKDFRIISLADKLRILKNLEIDFAIVLPFNQQLSEISAENFIEKILVKRLNIKHLTIGYDFIFGKNREGNFRLLEAEAKKFNFTLEEIAAVRNQDYTCSSTIIRNFIRSGNIKNANQILGRNFAISGLVNHGRKLATTIGFPTANLAVKSNIIQPKFGVYKTNTYIHHLKETFTSITNFGIKPTINSNHLPIYETHLIKFDGDLYNKKITIEFIDFIREEKKFSSLKDLQRQIINDYLL